MGTLSRLALTTTAALALVVSGFGTVHAAPDSADQVPAQVAAPTDESEETTPPEGDPAPEPDPGTPPAEDGTGDEQTPGEETSAPESPSDEPSSEEPTEEAHDPVVSLATTEITVEDLSAHGLTYSGSGFEPHASLVATAAYRDSGTLYLEEITADANGEISGIVLPEGVEPVPGEAVLSILESGEGPSVLAEAPFTIVDEEPPDEPVVSLAKSEVTATELASEGLAFSGSGFEPDTGVVALAAYADSQAHIYLEELTTDSEGRLSGVIDPPYGEMAPGTAVLSILESGEGPSVLAEARFTIVDDGTTPDPGLEPALTVSPESISAQAFTDAENGGVTLTVTACRPGDEAHFLVTPDDEEIVAFEDVQTLDAEGSASVRVYGLDADRPEAYVGSYDVTVTCTGLASVDGSFTVTGTGGGSGGSDGGTSIPRTGTELTGLVIGAGLLVVGGATLLLTARRQQVKSSGTR
ncbi:hypothetical protein [Brevibacterium album]|uniref:hypothetical protein n=1 Tax=Brevibacterium album TaxID=417948 RepID=UPI0004288915|nr:hypothetical protein [Brevibacterium album]